jgi:hypothetical protein
MGRRPLTPGRSRRATRLAGLALVALAASVAGAFIVLPLAVRAFVRGLQLAVDASVWVAASISTGMDAWTISTSIIRTVAGALATTEAFVVVLGLVGVGGAALFGLQRLLRDEQESSR